MDFITWWFAEHYVWSTIITPSWTLIWCFYTDEVFRAFTAIFFTWVWWNINERR